MVAQITSAQIRLGRTDDLIRVLQDIVAPTVTEQQGFQGRTLLIEPRTDRVLLLGLWATEADLIANERRDHFHVQFAKLDELLEDSSLREAYEVIVHVQMAADGAARIRGI